MNSASTLGIPLFYFFKEFGTIQEIYGILILVV